MVCLKETVQDFLLFASCLSRLYVTRTVTHVVCGTLSSRLMMRLKMALKNLHELESDNDSKRYPILSLKV